MFGSVVAKGYTADLFLLHASVPASVWESGFG